MTVIIDIRESLNTCGLQRISYPGNLKDYLQVMPQTISSL